MHGVEKAVGLSLGVLGVARVVLAGSCCRFGKILGYLGSPLAQQILFYVMLCYIINYNIISYQILYLMQETPWHGGYVVNGNEMIINIRYKYPAPTVTVRFRFNEIRQSWETLEDNTICMI